MKHPLLSRLFAYFLFVAFVGMPGAGSAFAQDAPVGGPYTVDENTVVLMHLDGTAENASDSTADGVIEGDVTFTAETPRDELGQSAYFDNSTSTRSVVTIADTAALDLTGDWTLETWVRTSFARSGPRLIMKPGSPAYQTNYYTAIEDRGRNHAHRGYRTGYRGEGNQFSADHIIQNDTWYHLAYIRDTTDSLLVQVIRDENLNLVWYGEFELNGDATPTAQPLFIGGHPGRAFLRLVGYLDEVRISNTVRHSLIPTAVSASAPVASGETGVVFDSLDTRVTFTTASSSNGRISATRPLAGPAASGFVADSAATSDDGTVVVPDEIVSSGYWLIGDRELETYEYEICLSADQVDDTTSAGKLVVARRAFPDAPWAPLNTTLQDVEGNTMLCAAALTSAGEFAIAVDHPPVPPAIELVTQYDSVQTVNSGPYAVEADVAATDDSVESVTLHFATEEGGAFQTAEMTAQDDTLYTAEIPSQEVGTVVRYYVTAEDGAGRTAYAPEGAEDGSDSYLLYVGQEESLVLHLSFENGEGTPVDSSDYEHIVDVLGDPTYIDDAPRGSRAIAFDGDGDFLEVPPPALFLANEEFTVSFWFKVDSLKELHGRLLVKEGGHGRTGAWWRPNYQFFANNDNGILRGVPYNGTALGDQMQLSKAVSPDTWYLAILQATEDSTFFQVRNLDGSIFDEVGTGLAEPAIPTKGPFRVAGSSANARPYFEGMMDDVRVYNYAANLSDITGVATEEIEELPTRFTLESNYPNPFRRSTTIRYALPKASDITLSVYDVLGRKVATLVDKKQVAGTHQVDFNGSGLANGVYFYRLEAGETLKVRKMMLIK